MCSMKRQSDNLNRVTRMLMGFTVLEDDNDMIIIMIMSCKEIRSNIKHNMFIVKILTRKIKFLS